MYFISFQSFFLSSGVCHTGSGQSGSGQSGSGQNGSGGQSSATTVNGTSGGRPETDSLTTADVILLAENFTGQTWCPKVDRCAKSVRENMYSTVDDNILTYPKNRISLDSEIL